MDNLYFILYSSFILFLVGLFIGYLLSRKEPNPLKKTISFYRITLTMLQVYLIWLAFSATWNLPVFSSFGKPHFPNQLQSPEQILNYLQDYNTQITRISLVLHILILSCMVLIVVFQITLTSLQKEVINVNNSEKEKT